MKRGYTLNLHPEYLLLKTDWLLQLQSQERPTSMMKAQPWHLSEIFYDYQKEINWMSTNIVRISSFPMTCKHPRFKVNGNSRNKMSEDQTTYIDLGEGFDNPSSIVEELKAGFQRFLRGHSAHPHASEARRHQLAGGQHPQVALLACSDSRVPVEVIFDAGFGDVFVIRNAGNTNTVRLSRIHRIRGA